MKNLDPKNAEMLQAFDMIANTNSSFFLTGSAGTGKTTFLHYVQEKVKKNFVVVAPTGVAAINAGGETIHSFFGLPTEVMMPDTCPEPTCGKPNGEHSVVLQMADTIIIDEISMVRCDMMDAIDLTLRRLMKNNLPFGGKQMVFVGDLFQLPPVVINTNGDKNVLQQIYRTNTFYFYKANVMKRLRFAKIEFRKVYRQKGDKHFIDILERVRRGSATAQDLEDINTRVCLPSSDEGSIVTLVPKNVTADAINQNHLAALETKEYVYDGIVEGDFEKNKFPVEQELHLKVGAQVMFIHNDSQKRWVNGTLGVVEKLTDDHIHVALNNGEVYDVPKASWDSYKYHYDAESKKLKKEKIGTYIQFPLKLAWSFTIHKSQGKTFDKMIFDPKGLFDNGQLYVALSRVRSLDGLYLFDKILPHYVRTSLEVLNFAVEYNNKHIIENELASGKAVYKALQKDDYDTAAKQYLKLVEQRYLDGDIKGALHEAKRCLDIMVCDEHLFGEIKTAPKYLKHPSHWSVQFLIAMLSLYARKFDQALKCVNKVLEQHKCPQALFVKSRALTKLKRYKAADAVNAQLAETFNAAQSDAKVLYMIAMNNELFMNEPGLDYMRQLVKARPHYDLAISSLRNLMKRHGMALPMSAESKNELVEAFNSDMTEKKFINLLKVSRKNKATDVAALKRKIARLRFDNDTVKEHYEFDNEEDLDDYIEDGDAELIRM